MIELWQKATYRERTYGLATGLAWLVLTPFWIFLSIYTNNALGIALGVVGGGGGLLTWFVTMALAFLWVGDGDACFETNGLRSRLMDIRKRELPAKTAKLEQKIDELERENRWLTMQIEMELRS